MSKPDFIVKCEGDIERVCSVFCQWLKTDDTLTSKTHRIQVPNEYWAELFVDIYTDEIANNSLSEEAEANSLNLVFEPTHSILDEGGLDSLKGLTNDALLDAMHDAIEELEDRRRDEEEDDDEEDEDEGPEGDNDA